MKKTLVNSLVLALTLSLSLSTYPKTAVAADKPAPVTSPAEYIKQVMEEDDALFGPDGPAIRHEDGTVSVKYNETTDETINGDEKEEKSISTEKRVTKHQARMQEALRLQAEIEKQPDAPNSADCTSGNCNGAAPATAGLEDESHAQLCSASEKAAIAKQKKSPSCSLAHESFSAGSCLSDFLESLTASFKSTWNTIKGGSSAIWGATKEWFKDHSKSEDKATTAATVLSNVPDEVVKNPKTLKEKFFAGIGKVLEFFGYDVPMVNETMDCAKCGQQAAAVCKVLGIVGRDAAILALITVISGGVLSFAFKGVKAGAKGVSMLAKKSSQSVTASLRATRSGAKLVEWGSHGMAAVNRVTVQAFKKAIDKNPAIKKFAAWSGTKLLKGLEKTDRVLNAPANLIIAGGKKVGIGVKALGARAGIFKAAPVKAEAKIANDGLTTLEKVGEEPHDLKIEVPRPMTPAMNEAKRFLANEPGIKGKLNLDGIENATHVPHTRANAYSVKVETLDGPAYIKVGNSSEVEKVFPYFDEVGGKQAALVVTKSGEVKLANIANGKGEIFATLSKNKAGKVEALLGKENYRANQIAVQNVEKNLQENGIKFKSSSELKGSGNKAALKIEKDAVGPGCPVQGMSAVPAMN